MTTQQDERAELIRKLHSMGTALRHPELIRAAALLAADAQAGGEVVWGIKYDGRWTDEIFTSLKDAEREHGWDNRSMIVPLYTRPQPQAVAQGWKLYGNRQDFERYAAEQGYRDFEQNEFDGYKNSHTQARWNFWRAGQDAMLSAAPKPQEPA